MKNPKAVGEKTEACILAELVKHDIAVSTPFGENQRYDMIIDVSGKLFKVQCKTGRYRNGCVVFSSCSTNPDSPYMDYRGQADFFAVYCEEVNGYYLISPDLVGKRSGQLRVEEAKNGQSSNVKWAVEYELPRVLATLAQ